MEAAIIELVSAARIPVAIGLIAAVLLVGARAFGVGRPRSNREIAEFVTMTGIIATAANIGRDDGHYWLTIGLGMAAAFAASLLLRRVTA